MPLIRLIILIGCFVFVIGAIKKLNHDGLGEFEDAFTFVPQQTLNLCAKNVVRIEVPNRIRESNSGFWGCPAKTEKIWEKICTPRVRAPKPDLPLANFKEQAVYVYEDHTRVYISVDPALKLIKTSEGIYSSADFLSAYERLKIMTCN